jgi:hypothetical protein
LEQAIQQQNKWKQWGQINRSIFEQRYREDQVEEWLAEPLLSLVTTSGSPDLPLAAKSPRG